jgi:hypothetical protein
MLQAAGEFSSILVEAQEDHHMAIDDRLYTIAEVAQYLGMSPYTVTTWIKTGGLIDGARSARLNNVFAGASDHVGRDVRQVLTERAGIR